MIHPVQHVRGEPVVAGGVVAHVLPQRAGLVRHVGKVALDIVVQRLAATVTIQQIQPQVVADEGIGGIDLRIQPARSTVVAEVMQQRLPQPRMALSQNTHVHMETVEETKDEGT